jgi:hypothetical protein
MKLKIHNILYTSVVKSLMAGLEVFTAVYSEISLLLEVTQRRIILSQMFGIHV